MSLFSVDSSLLGALLNSPDRQEPLPAEPLLQREAESPESVVDITDEVHARQQLDNPPVFIDLTESPIVELSATTVDLRSSSDINVHPANPAAEGQEVTQDAGIDDPSVGFPPGFAPTACPFQLENYQLPNGTWVNFKEIEDARALVVEVPEDITRKTLLLWESFGWYHGFQVAPCIVNSPRTCYVEKLEYTSKELRKLNDRPIISRQ
eukprot:gene33722-43423_t